MVLRIKPATDIGTDDSAAEIEKLHHKTKHLDAMVPGYTRHNKGNVTYEIT